MPNTHEHPALGVEEVTEHFAAMEHARWSRWQEYLHKQCFRSPEFTGALIIPADLVARWERQISTPYSQLTEAEKESDRKEVRPYIEYATNHHQKSIEAVVDAAWEYMVEATRAGSWSKEELRKYITSDTLKS